jgi:hypothetical protein
MVRPPSPHATNPMYVPSIVSASNTFSIQFVCNAGLSRNRLGRLRPLHVLYVLFYTHMLPLTHYIMVESTTGDGSNGNANRNTPTFWEVLSTKQPHAPPRAVPSKREQVQLVCTHTQTKPHVLQPIRPSIYLSNQATKDGAPPPPAAKY